MDIQQLNEKYGIEGNVQFFLGGGSLIFARLSNQFGTAEVSLYGGHVTSYKPTEQEDVLWMSDKSCFVSGKAIRGGVPVCFPWFGPHDTDNKKAIHGFARLYYWNVTKTETFSDESVSIWLNLESSPATRAIWEYNFSASLEITIHKSLKISFNVVNTDNRPFIYTDALHSYFYVGDIEKITIEGLQGAKFYKASDKSNTFIQSSNLLEIRKEENRRYIGTSADCIIYDEVLKRSIRISKQGSMTTVVWNPWSETVLTMNDMSEDAYRKMVCIEPVNAYNDFVRLEPRQSHTISTEIEMSFLG
jgi:glucose-6-phosphate 1-epimerase